MSKVIAIAGMGWLGQSLAQHLMLLGYRVKGSVTSMHKAAALQSKGFNAYPVEITEDGVSGEPQAFLRGSDIITIMIPPGLRRYTGADYVLKMSHFLSEIKAAQVKKVIMVSSTSVYGDAQGKITEKDNPKPTTQAGKQLVQVEQLFFNATGFNTSIVRFGGLFGGSRQPVRYLAGRKDLNDGDAPVNLIHKDDCIRILSEIIKQDAFGYIFNAVTPQHPIKKEYYMQKATDLNLSLPHFSKENARSAFKQIDSINLGEILGYTFKHKL